VGLGVSCSADRQALGKITRDGVFLEQLETDPGKYLPDVVDEHLEEVSFILIRVWAIGLTSCFVHRTDPSWTWI
tara:strand:+ start:1934 stop:2155 length:222 start_codon:yes stop_codon:yes gene_type:complete